MELFDNRYKQLDLIGRGSFSEVWKVLDTETNVIQALKIYRPEKGISNDGIEMLKHEYALLNDATHPNLLRPSFFMFSGKSGVPPYLILTFCEKGNVGKLMMKLDEQEVWRLIRDTASALAYLHGKNPPVIHQDIKPENILASNDGIYQLTDFGISTQAKSDGIKEADKQMQSAGTISYMAPERFAPDSMPIKASDVYSLGVTLFELTAGYLPFGNSGGLAQRKEHAAIPEIPGNYSPLLKETIASCLQEEPWKRPLAAKLEEIANAALKKPVLQTVTPVEAQSEQSPTAEAAPSLAYSAHNGEKKHVWKILLGMAATILVVIVCVAAWNATYQEDSPEPVPTTVVEQSPVTEPEPEPVETAEAVETTGPADDVKDEPASEEATPENVATPKQEPMPEKPAVSVKTSSKTASASIDLGYAEWKGGIRDGKPHGQGVMTFRSAHRIDSRDPQRNVAQSGDKVEGNYINGHLEYGTWVKSDGERIQIYIGQ